MDKGWRITNKLLKCRNANRFRLFQAISGKDGGRWGSGDSNVMGQVLLSQSRGTLCYPWTNPFSISLYWVQPPIPEGDDQCHLPSNQSTSRKAGCWTSAEPGGQTLKFFLGACRPLSRPTPHQPNSQSLLTPPGRVIPRVNNSRSINQHPCCYFLE